MIRSVLILCLCAVLSGCIIFDQKSEAVVFHQFLAPAAQPAPPPSAGPLVFIPRAILPSALRRPNVVLLDDNGWVQIEDAHRWVAPLDRAIPETLGRLLMARTGVATTAQTPSDDHLVLLLTVDKLEISTQPAAERTLFSFPGTPARAATASLQLSCRLEKADGTLVAARTLAHVSPLKERTAAAFVQAQSANLAALSAELAPWLRAATPSSSK